MNNKEFCCEFCGSAYLVDCHQGYFLCGDCGYIVDYPSICNSCVYSNGDSLSFPCSVCMQFEDGYLTATKYSRRG